MDMFTWQVDDESVSEHDAMSIELDPLFARDDLYLHTSSREKVCGGE